jgi:hypothetical protein
MAEYLKAVAVLDKLRRDSERKLAAATSPEEKRHWQGYLSALRDMAVALREMP